VTIESALVMSPETIAVINDNNYRFSIGRRVIAKEPDEQRFHLHQASQEALLSRRRLLLETSTSRAGYPRLH
jgi:hypothetical protein